MTLRLSEEKEVALELLAETLHLSKNMAAAEAITLAAPRPNHPAFVADSMRRQLSRYADLMTRLASA
jgi:predicted transcriptional regulator